MLHVRLRVTFVGLTTLTNQLRAGFTCQRQSGAPGVADRAAISGATRYAAGVTPAFLE